MIKQTKTALGLATASLALAGALASPQATAQTQAERVAEAAAKKTAVLQEQVSQMAVMMEAMQAELNRVKLANTDVNSVNTAKVQEIDQWMASMKHAPAISHKKQNMVFFRGGYARNDHGREGDILTDANTNLSGTGGNIAGLGITTNDLTSNRANGDQEAWYFGAGFEFNLTDDLYGLWDNTNLLGEVTFAYKEFSAHDIINAPLATAANDSASGAASDLLGVGSVPANGPVCGVGGLTDGLGGPYGACGANIAVTQFTLTAAPKIKFMSGSKLRPWLIPAGFALHVVSPPSDAVTVFAPGVLFGMGADYELYKGIVIGADARYHLVADAVDNVDLGGFEAGGYVGFSF